MPDSTENINQMLRYYVRLALLLVKIHVFSSGVAQIGNMVHNKNNIIYIWYTIIQMLRYYIRLALLLVKIHLFSSGVAQIGNMVHNKNNIIYIYMYTIIWGSIQYRRGSIWGSIMYTIIYIWYTIRITLEKFKYHREEI